MSDLPIPIAILATDVATRAKVSSYPEPFALRMAGREKRILGDLFGRGSNATCSGHVRTLSSAKRQRPQPGQRD